MAAYSDFDVKNTNIKSAGQLEGRVTGTSTASSGSTDDLQRES